MELGSVIIFLFIGLVFFPVYLLVGIFVVLILDHNIELPRENPYRAISEVLLILLWVPLVLLTVLKEIIIYGTKKCGIISRGGKETL